MKQCPQCRQWTLDFDEYFGRFRCFNPECEWIPASKTEREMRLLECRKYPIEVCQRELPELGLKLEVKYDSINDVLKNTCSSYSTLSH